MRNWDLKKTIIDIYFLVEPVSINIIPSTEEGIVKFKPGENLKLTCQVDGGRPKANITWTFSTNPKKSESQEKTIDVLSNGKKTVTTINEILIRPSQSDHLSKVTCAADHITLNNPMKKEIKLQYVGML